MKSSRPVYMCISQSTIQDSVMSCLGASDAASFIHAFGIKHTSALRKMYMDPVRDLGTFADWVEHKKMLGIKLLFVGMDVKRWLDRIKMPWSDKWKRPYPITIWPAIVRTDGTDTLGELRDVARRRLDGGDHDMHEDLSHTADLIENFLTISGVKTVKYLHPPTDTGHVRVGTNNWTECKTFNAHENGIKIVFWSEYISGDGAMTVTTNYHLDADEYTRRSKLQFLLEPEPLRGIQYTDEYMSMTGYKTWWYDPGTFKSDYVAGVPEWFDDRHKSPTEDELVIRVLVMGVNSYVDKLDIVRVNVIRIPMPNEYK